MGLRDIIGKDTWIRVTYRSVKDLYYRQREDKFLSSTLNDVFHFNCYSKQNSKLLIITVVYNRADMVAHQLRLLPKYLTDPFQHIVVDNSRDNSARKSVAQLCEHYQVGYVSLPKNFYTHASNSHGLALNWIYQHLIKAFNPDYFGFLDHDIFPIRSHSILEHLITQPIYGQKDTRKNVWYLWPGFSFYQTSLLENIHVNFKPGMINDTMVDTGGQVQVIHLVDKKHLLFAVEHQTSVQKGHVPHQHNVEWLKIDEVVTWFHCIGAGHWKDATLKERVIKEILATY